MKIKKDTHDNISTINNRLEVIQNVVNVIFNSSIDITLLKSFYTLSYPFISVHEINHDRFSETLSLLNYYTHDQEHLLNKLIEMQLSHQNFFYGKCVGYSTDYYYLIYKLSDDHLFFAHFELKCNYSWYNFMTSIIYYFINTHYNIVQLLNEIAQEREKLRHEFTLIQNESNHKLFNIFPFLFVNETDFKDDIVYFTLLTKIMYFIVNNNNEYCKLEDHK